jgi:phospholipase/carboxylesterase
MRGGWRGLWWIAVLVGCTRAAEPSTSDAAQSTQAAPVPAEASGPLSFVTWTSPGAGEHEALPTVIAVHGRGDQAERFVALFEGLPGPVRVVAPRAPIPWGEGGSWFTDAAHRLDQEVLAEQMRARAGQVAALITALSADYPVRGKPVIAGFSQGGMLSFAVAIEHPEAIAGAVPVAGYLPVALVPDGAPRVRVPVRALHGEADDVLPLEPTQRGVAALQAAGFDVSMRTWPGVGHTIEPEQRAVLHATVTALLASP